MERAVELAGFFAAHAVWSVADGETLIPLLAFQRTDGKQEFRRIEAEQLEDAVAQGKQPYVFSGLQTSGSRIIS
jgi:hypothetical protein